jgi:membrane-associated phospholipid phosphatase
MPLSALLAARPASAAFVAAAAVAFSVLAFSAPARAEGCANAEPWARLGASGSNFVRPGPLALSALAVITPFGFSPTGLDQRLRVVAQRDLHGRPNLEPVSVWTPYVLAAGLTVGYGISALAGSCAGKRGLSPLLQAGVITFVGVGTLKLGVGRRWPNGGRDPSAPDRLEHPEGAHDYAPFQRGFAAWPSGHSALMFAAASAFRASNPELGLAAWLGYPLALGVAGGMWLGDHHFASDIVSGALLGEAVGGSVGRNFSEALGVPGQLALVPVDQTGFGLQWLGRW